MMKGKVIKYEQDNIDTDVILPGPYLKLHEHSELAEHAMEGMDPDFHAKVKNANIIVTGNNFGCGSSREHAPIALSASGIEAVLALSFARIFYRNSVDGAYLLPIEIDEKTYSSISENDELEIDTDNNQIKNITKNQTYSNVAELVQSIPEIDRDPENIVALNPDIVVTSEYFPEESIQRLNDLNIPVIQTGMASSIEEQKGTILLLGHIYGEEQRATQLVAEIAERYDFIESIIEQQNASKKKKVLSITRYSDQIWAAGSDSTEGMIIESAGGINSAAESGIKGNMTTSIEGVIEMAPEIIIIAQPRESGGDEFREYLVNSRVTQQIPAVLYNEIYFVETKHFTTLSFWNIRGIEELAKLLWPEDIGDKSFGGFSLP